MVNTAVGETHYFEYGDGLPLLLIHDGSPGADSVSCWYQCLDDLASEFRVIAVDMLGFGANAGSPESGLEYSHEARVAHLLDFLEAMELTAVNMVGFSLGGAVALDCAVQQPRSVRKIVAAAPAGLSADIPAELGPLMSYRGEIEQMQALLSALGGPSFSPDDDLVQYRTKLSNTPHNGLAWQKAMAIIGSRGGLYLGESSLSSIEQPAMLVYGELDPIVSPQTAKSFTELVPVARACEIPGSGHWLPYEAPQALGRLCREHFASGDIA